MALSTYYNWDTLQTVNSEISTFHEAEATLALAPPHHHNFPYLDESFFLSNTLFDPYYEYDPYSVFLYPEIHPSQLLLPCTSSSHDESLITINEIFSTEEYLPCPKRQKCCYEEQELVHSALQDVMSSNFLDGFVPNNPCNSLLKAEELCSEFKVPQLPQGGSSDLQCEKKANERIISAQSIAARERRRKITEKTQELGKLFPGGPKMNTAEMLHAAAKYVKYLQAQVEMLQLMKTLKEDNAAPPSGDLHTLLVSPLVQEKLYSEERCFVPKEFVTTLTNHDDVQSKPIILKDLKQLIGADTNQNKTKQE